MSSKTDNGNVVVTTHLYDGKKSLPLDIELYKHLEAFRTAVSYRFVEWLNHNRDVFIAYKASLGLVWA